MSRSSLSFFLLIVSFGILFAGCAKPEPEKSFEEFTFSDTDLQQVEALAQSSSGTVQGEDYTTLSIGASGSGAMAPSVLSETFTALPNEEEVRLFENIRASSGDQGGNVYRVNNPYLNVREAMDVGSAQVARLNQGDSVTVTDIPSAEWAKIKTSAGVDGYVAFRYLAKVTTDKKLPEDKKQFEGKYFVDFAFLNMRKDPTTQAVKVGEIPGQAIVQPLSMNGEWAKVIYDGKEGYVSAQYLKPFQPTFLVRQEEYRLPILQYYADDAGSMGSLAKHVAALKAAGKRVVTLKALYDVVLSQESRDARVNPDTVVVVISGVGSKNVKQVSDALQTAGISATIFLETKDIGLTGITEKMILNLQANGNDLQSSGHTGDDLRSMTDSQVMLELGQSKKLIEDISKKSVYAFSYPKGGVNDRIMKQAADIGYLFGVSQSPDAVFSRSQFLRLPTFIVSSGMSPDDIVKLTK